MSDYLKHFEIFDGIFRIRAPGYDPGAGPGDGTFGGLGKNMIDVIVGDEYAAVIDTGYGDVDLKGYIEQNITRKPLIVFNSHGHIDHVRGNVQFDEVWIHEADVEGARHIMNPNIDVKGHPVCEAVKRGTGCKFNFVHEGQVFDLGGRTLTVYYLPGHTLGCICLYDDKCRVLFSGDAILKRCGINALNRHELKKHLEKIKKVDFDCILGGHWDMPMDREQVDRFIRICDEFTPEKTVKMINTLGGHISETYQFYLGTEFADPEFACVNVRDPQAFYGSEEEK